MGSGIRTILVIGHTNIGDAIIASPVIEYLHQRYPQAQLTYILGARAAALFAGDRRVHQLLHIEAFGEGIQRIRMATFLWSLRPDLLIDLRQTILPLLWRPARMARYVWPVPRAVRHMRQRHLWRMHRQLRPLLAPLKQERLTEGLPASLRIPDTMRAQAQRQLQRWGIDTAKPLIIMCPGARGHTRRWYPDRFAQLADRLIDEEGAEIVLTGEPSDSELAESILAAMRHRAHNAVGLTTIAQLGAFMHMARLVIVQDSGVLHLADAVGAAVLALFGPSDPAKYGPTGRRAAVIQRRLFCVPCEVAQCRFNHECMRFISVDEVAEAARRLLEAAR